MDQADNGRWGCVLYVTIDAGDESVVVYIDPEITFTQAETRLGFKDRDGHIELTGRDRVRAIAEYVQQMLDQIEAGIRAFSGRERTQKGALGFDANFKPDPPQ